MKQKYTFAELVGVCTALILGLTLSLFAVQASEGILPASTGGFFDASKTNAKTVERTAAPTMGEKTLAERKRLQEARLKRRAELQKMEAKAKSTNGVMVKGVSVGTALTGSNNLLELDRGNDVIITPVLPSPVPATSTPTSTPRMERKEGKKTGLDRALQAKEEQIKKLQERIKQLEIKISEREEQVEEREKKIESKIDEKLANRLKGKILLQVEQNGEAWYIDPTTGQKYYLSDGDSAFQLLKLFGLGATDDVINNIPIGTVATGTPTSTPSLTKPLIPARLRLLEGKILLQVQQHGEAWYIKDGKRFYLRNGAMAYQILRRLGLGIKNNDLRAIPTGSLTTNSTSTDPVTSP